MTIPAELAAEIRRSAPTVVFDLDGCLVHSSPDIAAALNAVMAKHGASFTVVEVERMIGDGLGALFDKALAARGISLHAADVKAEFDAFYARYAAEPAVRSEARSWIADVARVLKSATANAENNHNLSADDLVVAAAIADEGPTIKRFRPRAQGRAFPIHKPMTHITIVVADQEA